MNLKQIVSAVLTVGALGAAGLAHADIDPDFVVNPTNFLPAGTVLAPANQATPGTTLGSNFVSPTFYADYLKGSYSETITITSANTFNIALIFVASSFNYDDGTRALGANQTGLGFYYGLYALFNGGGTLSTTNGTTTFNLQGGNLNVFIDGGANNGNLIKPTVADGVNGYSYGTGSGNDTSIATGTGKMGTGNLTCSVGNNCGSFGQVTTFKTTAAGNSFFVQPQPFYDMSFQSGNFNGFAPTVGTQELNGTMNVIFQRVPEPSSIALVGAAFVGLGFISRRKKA